MRKVLIVVDMQNDFITGSLGTPEARAVVPRVAERIRGAMKEGRTLLFTQDTHAPDYLDTQEGRNLPVRHCIRNTPGWQLHEAVAPFAAETVEKSTFGSIALAEALERLAENGGANLDVELCGVCTDICVVSNALLIKAHLPEAFVHVDAACCAGVTPERHNAALEVMRASQIQVSPA